MALDIKMENNKLLLLLTPESQGAIDYYNEKLERSDEFVVKGIFYVNKRILYKIDTEYEYTFKFCIGEIAGEYIKLDSNVFKTDHTFYFPKDVTIGIKDFRASYNISILAKIDEIIDKDFYIMNKIEEGKSGILINTFHELIKNFPNSYERSKYTNQRIGNILKEFIPQCDKYEQIYENYIIRKNNIIEQVCDRVTNESFLDKIKFEQFSTAVQELDYLISNYRGIPETEWQKKIHPIIRLLYPQYIFSAREVKFRGVDNYDKKPDFLLVDTNGFVDILEIKKPDAIILTDNPSYRNNYIPTKDFSGSIQQIEKYIFCLTTQSRSREDAKIKLEKKMKNTVNVSINFVNPRGILLAGLSNSFNDQQKRDFELVKRQYKNIADIMTYNDLQGRLKNIVDALS